LQTTDRQMQTIERQEMDIPRQLTLLALQAVSFEAHVVLLPSLEPPLDPPTLDLYQTRRRFGQN